MMRVLSILLVLVCSCLGSAQTVNEQIRFRQFDDTFLIDTIPSNYALTSAKLVQSNLKTIAINGDQVQIVRSSCERIAKKFNSLSQSEKSLIEEAKADIATVGRHVGQSLSFKKISNNFIRAYMGYLFDGSQTHSDAIGLKTASYEHNGLMINRFLDTTHFSVAKKNFPDGLARIFVNGDVVTYVYRNGQVQMEPINCLPAAKRQQLDQLKAGVKQANENLEKQMDEFGKNIEQSIEINVEQKLENMLGNGPQKQQKANVANKKQQQVSQQKQQSKPTTDNQNSSPFGNNFPFGPNNSPFGKGFPFNRR